MDRRPPISVGARLMPVRYSWKDWRDVAPNPRLVPSIAVPLLNVTHRIEPITVMQSRDSDALLFALPVICTDVEVEILLRHDVASITRFVVMFGINNLT